MKKSVFILLFSALLLGACSSSEGSADISKLEATIQSLEKENQELKDMLAETETVAESIESKENELPTEVAFFSDGEEVTISDQDGNEMYSLKIIEATTNITPDSGALNAAARPAPAPAAINVRRSRGGTLSHLEIASPTAPPI